MSEAKLDRSVRRGVRLSIVATLALSACGSGNDGAPLTQVLADRACISRSSVYPLLKQERDRIAKAGKDTLAQCSAQLDADTEGETRMATALAEKAQLEQSVATLQEQVISLESRAPSDTAIAGKARVDQESCNSIMTAALDAQGASPAEAGREAGKTHYTRGSIDQCTVLTICHGNVPAWAIYVSCAEPAKAVELRKAILTTANAAGL
ncbi:hypothetical protein [Sphingomonas sp. Leaf25]|uniref:hypothetical protein n=1 Tax=Sphingomonas sp. Leaf25 TaxID=1735692 RepID=UPI000700B4C3|nr:hypothetical protein [Sphingomonas sp. Leaf25]KQN05187.1 hypothetical protein ASE78_16825 [Sphingomonas sp. Leaf25]